MVVVGYLLILLLVAVATVGVWASYATQKKCGKPTQKGEPCPLPRSRLFTWCHVAKHRPAWIRWAPEWVIHNGFLTALGAAFLAIVPSVVDIPELLRDDTKSKLIELNQVLDTRGEQYRFVRLRSIIEGLDAEAVERDHPEYLIVFGDALAAIGAVSEGMRLARLHVEQAPDDFVLRTKLARMMYEYEKDYEACIDECARALKPGPTYYVPRFFRAASVIQLCVTDGGSLRTARELLSGEKVEELLAIAEDDLRRLLATDFVGTPEPGVTQAAARYMLVSLLLHRARVDEALAVAKELPAVYSTELSVSECEFATQQADLYYIRWFQEPGIDEYARTAADALRARMQRCVPDLQREYYLARVDSGSFLRDGSPQNPAGQARARDLALTWPARFTLDPVGAWTKCIQVLVDMNNWELADRQLQLAESAIRSGATDCTLRAFRAKIDYGLKQHERAFAGWRAALADSRCSVLEYGEDFGLALIRHHQKMTLDERQTASTELSDLAARMLLEMRSEPTLPAKEAVAEFFFGHGLFWRNDLDDAINHLEAAVRLDPTAEVYSKCLEYLKSERKKLRERK